MMKRRTIFYLLVDRLFLDYHSYDISDQLVKYYQDIHDEILFFCYYNLKQDDLRIHPPNFPQFTHVVLLLYDDHYNLLVPFHKIYHYLDHIETYIVVYQSEKCYNLYLMLKNRKSFVFQIIPRFDSTSV